MSTPTRQITLRRHPMGWVTPNDFEIREAILPAPPSNHVLVRAIFMSLDPYMRGRMDANKTYAQNFQIGEPLKARVIGEVIHSRHANFNPGDLVHGMVDWADISIAQGSNLRHVDPTVAPLPYYLGALGMPGMTAWIGMEMGAPRPGETVFVSAASGAVGQIAGQIAKLQSCRTVGCAGSDEKTAFLLDELGFDAAFNYKSSTAVLEALKVAAPNGVDMYFDNVGGIILEAALDHANNFARFIQCGLISQYNLSREETTGVRNLTHINRKRIRMEGFIVSDHSDRLEEFMSEMKAWLSSGQIRYRIDITNGLENAPEAFISMLKGGNFGKQVVQIGPTPPESHEAKHL